MLALLSSLMLTFVFVVPLLGPVVFSPALLAVMMLPVMFSGCLTAIQNISGVTYVGLTSFERC